MESRKERQPHEKNTLDWTRFRPPLRVEVIYLLYKKSKTASQDEDMVMTPPAATTPEREEPIPAEPSTPAPENGI